MKLWHSVIHPITAHFRRRRGAWLRARFPEIEKLSILDVGGSRHFWEKLDVGVGAPQVVIVNVSENETASISPRRCSDWRFVLYDGKRLPFRDGEFDLVVSNSVIEHVPPAARRSFVKEIRRVGQAVFVQTPDAAFPIEPHFLMPAVHWLPRRLGRVLVEISPWRLLSRPARRTIESYFWGTSLLSRRDVQGLFPDCEVDRERFLGFSKSHLIVCNADCKSRAVQRASPSTETTL